MSFLKRFTTPPDATAASKAEKVAECLQEIADEAPALADCDSRRHALLLRGSDTEVATLDKEAAGIRLRADRARALLPRLREELEAKRAEERAARLKALLLELEAAAPPYLAAMYSVAPAASEVARIRGLIAAAYPAEAMALPGVVVLAVDLNSLRSHSGNITPPTELLDFSESLQRSLKQIRRGMK